MAKWAGFSGRLGGIGARLANCFEATFQNQGRSIAFGLEVKMANRAWEADVEAALSPALQHRRIQEIM
jgi:hypothetical protein